MATFGNDREERGDPFHPASNQRLVGQDEGAHQHVLPDRHARKETAILRNMDDAACQPLAATTGG